MRKRPLKFIIAYERSKNKKKANESRHAIHKTDHKQNYYRSFLYKDKLGLHLIWKKTLSEDFQEVQTTFRKSRRLSGSPDDFQEEVPPTEVEVVWKTSWKSSSALYSRRLTVRTLYNKKLPNEEKLVIKTYQNTHIYYERETSWKSSGLQIQI
ncbi:hypothetical protein IGI04_015266 [Brassica rapa subsp. trilocularis]|uniref:Uncharacterized protein n=1 Tax=Brassica rapa subsp. trilocularis TaxID=1813537 RepID=A0ABQ7MPJ7_BRACM|nr:hypothetical protein IGI04_015266 [Brassica rapa subsp. trilocularis]